MSTLTRSGVIPYKPGQFLYYFTKNDVPLIEGESACILKRRFTGSVRIAAIYNQRKFTKHTVFFELEGEKDMISENDIFDTYDKALSELIAYTKYMHPSEGILGSGNITLASNITTSFTTKAPN